MIVHANIYDPSRPSIFGSKASDRSECQTIDCSNNENCDLLKRGECAITYGLFVGNCPYGKYRREYGYTRRANRFRSWISERRELYAGVTFLKSPKRLGIVGDYMFLPYPHMDINEGIFGTKLMFVPLSEFTIDKIRDLCLLRPMAMFGGEITSYQEEVVPLFVLHISETMPNLYRSLCIDWPRAKEIVDSYSNVGRKALLSSIRPNESAFIDCHGGEWIWDGEYLTMTNRTSALSFVKCSEERIKPMDGVTVEISSDSQVDENTVYVD